MKLDLLLAMINQCIRDKQIQVKVRGRVKLPDENKLVELRIIGASSVPDKGDGHVYIDMETIP